MKNKVLRCVTLLCAPKKCLLSELLRLKSSFLCVLLRVGRTSSQHFAGLRPKYSLFIIISKCLASPSEQWTARAHFAVTFDKVIVTLDDCVCCGDLKVHSDESACL